MGAPNGPSGVLTMMFRHAGGYAANWASHCRSEMVPRVAFAGSVRHHGDPVRLQLYERPPIERAPQQSFFVFGVTLDVSPTGLDHRAPASLDHCTPTGLDHCTATY